MPKEHKSIVVQASEMSNEELIRDLKGWDTNDFPNSIVSRFRQAAHALETSEADADDLASRLSEYLCDSTGGLLSKTGYTVRVMVAHTEEYYERLHADNLKEVQDELDNVHSMHSRALDDIQEYSEAIAKVRGIHNRRELWTGGGRYYWGCDHDRQAWPCATIKALTSTTKENHD